MTLFQQGLVLGRRCCQAAPTATQQLRRCWVPSAAAATQARRPAAADSDSGRRLGHLAALGAAAAAAGLTMRDSSSRCEPQALHGPIKCEAIDSNTTIITLNFEKDRTGLLADTTDLLKAQGLDIRDAKITTKDSVGMAQHRYTVQEKATGKGLSDKKLAEVKTALERLGQVSVATKAWPLYTRSEVAKHTTADNGIWVTYKSGVYDITDFIANHPGGKDKILLAAGKAIDPFWRIYQQHEGRGTALGQLEQLRIGDLSDPIAPSPTDLADPYAADPHDRHPGLIYHNSKPCNAEMPCELVMDSWLTPNPVWFIRHHHPVPVIDADKYMLQVEGVGTKPVKLTLEDLKTRFLKREVTSTIQCGGNRRSELDKIQKTSGIPWGTGAMSNAKWGGVYLREVLMHCAGVNYEGLEFKGPFHIVCYGADDMQASIPMEKALNPFGDVILAYEMNGEELPSEHGFPVRLVVPGVVGVRNVKWVDRIRISLEEAEGPWQRGIAYKGFSPMQKDCTGVDVEKIQSMQEMPVQSTIMTPKPGFVTELDDIEVKGWAWSGGGRGIVRVDVSIDDGKTWTTAELGSGKDQHPMRAWAWTFWEASIEIPEGMKGKEIEVLCRATDSSYSAQPEYPAPIWNLRGLNCNCWHRVKFQHKDE